MNLYTRWKLGLLSRWPVRTSQVRTFTKNGEYHMRDDRGREVSFSPTDAAVTVLSLTALLRKNRDVVW